MRRRIVVGAVLLTLVAGGSAGAIALTGDDESPGAAHATPSSTLVPSTTAAPSTTASSTTAPPVAVPEEPDVSQPLDGPLPAPPPEGVGPGTSSRVVATYQQRLTDLRFDPGPVDGSYGAATAYAVRTLQKLQGLPVTGAIGAAEFTALNEFTEPAPLAPDAEPNRTEVDVSRQVLTLYQDGHPRLFTTVSTGSGEHYCYEQPVAAPTERVCEVATTPSGRFTYYLFRPGWDVGVLGGLYNPVYFNGGIAVHGYDSVPPTPASHGCVRIPMHIAEYFPSLVHVGDPVYVFGGAPAEILSREPLT